MKFTTRNIILWSFWPILALIAFGSYFFIGVDIKQDHLNYIPSKTKSVVMINLMSLFRDYENLLEEDPSALSDFKMESDGEELSLRIGINPLKKVALCQINYQEENVIGFALVAEVTNFSDFVGLINQRDNIPEEVKFKEGGYILVEKDDEVFVHQGKVGVMYKLQKGKVTDELATEIFDSFFDAGTSLMSENENFKAVAQDGTNQIEYWSKEGVNLADNYNKQLSFINDMFDQKNIYVNLDKAGLLVDASLAMRDENAIIPRDESEVSLMDGECFRFAASVDPNQFSEFFELVLTEDKKYLLNDWNGGLCASVNGFEDINIKKVQQVASTDPLYPFQYDTVGVFDTGMSSFIEKLDGQFAYPYFTIACELTDVAKLQETIEMDSTISQVGEYYSFVFDNYFIEKKESTAFGLGSVTVLVPQRIYFYFVDNSIVFAPELPESTFQPQYSTFSVLFDFDTFFNTFHSNSMLVSFAIEKMQELGLKGYDLEYQGVEEGRLILKGGFYLKDTDNHFVGFPMLMKKLMSFSLM